MANKSSNKMIGITLMLLGAGLAYWGYDMSGAINSQLSQAFTGSSSDDVMIRYIAGAASFVVGLFLFSKK
jgi:hypothetical protein